MALTYQTRDGDTLDWICWKHYGRQSGAVETVLEANRNLASLGPIYPAGVEILLPDLIPSSTTSVVRLWD